MILERTYASFLPFTYPSSTPFPADVILPSFLPFPSPSLPVSDKEGVHNIGDLGEDVDIFVILVDERFFDFIIVVFVLPSTLTLDLTLKMLLHRLLNHLLEGCGCVWKCAWVCVWVWV